MTHLNQLVEQLILFFKKTQKKFKKSLINQIGVNKMAANLQKYTVLHDLPFTILFCKLKLRMKQLVTYKPVSRTTYPV